MATRTDRNKEITSLSPYVHRLLLTRARISYDSCWFVEDALSTTTLLSTPTSSSSTERSREFLAEFAGVTPPPPLRNNAEQSQASPLDVAWVDSLDW